MMTVTGEGASETIEPEALTLAVVMPAYNAEPFLALSLTALLRQSSGHTLLVVDPGSTDRTAQLAEELGAQVIRLGHRAGPAEARNAGVRACDADVIVFIDSDCVVSDEVLERILLAFSREPQLVSLTGSYDEKPSERNFASLYMNLRHHYVHQHAQREGAGFWAGCGAVRRQAFETVGGFDAERYPMPMIEDIDLGLRLRHVGSTRLDPELQVKHLKRWSLGSVIATDIFKRALPWSKLILESGELPNDLNVRLSQRVAALWAPLSLAGLAILPWALWTGEAAVAAACALAQLVAFGLHLGMLRFFARTGGVFFSLAGLIFHQVHLLYSAITYAYCVVRHRTSAAGRQQRTRLEPRA